MLSSYLNTEIGHIMKNKQFSITKGQIKAIGLEINPEIQEKYGDDQDKLEHANAAQYYLQEYLRNMPIGMVGLEDKRNMKKELKTYIMGRLDGSIQSPDDAKGFFFLGFLGLSILSAIISFIVQKWLWHLYPDKD